MKMRVVGGNMKMRVGGGRGGIFKFHLNRYPIYILKNMNSCL